jgi:hypothetical protein
MSAGLDRKPLKDRIVLYEARTGHVIRRWSDSGKPANWEEALCFSADGRLLASSDGSLVHVWEAATGQELRALRGHRGDVHALAFSGNGRRLASASDDRTCLIWDLPAAVGAGESSPAGAREAAAWWADLADADAGRAYAAVWRLAAVPATAVPLLARHVRPATTADVDAVRRSVADLDAASFAVRRKAVAHLRNLGLAAAPVLRQASQRDLPLEVRRRVEQLLEDLRNRPVSGEWLRTLRALAVLEHAHTPEAHRVLRALAGGAPGAWLTDQAEAVCARLPPGAAP